MSAPPAIPTQLFAPSSPAATSLQCANRPRTRAGIGRSMISAEAPGGRYARREHARRYVTDEQRSRPGWIGAEGDRLIPTRALSVLTFFLPGVALAASTRGPVLPGSFASHQVEIMGALALLATVPFAVMMLTSFSKIVVVLSIARSAMGTQQAPPTIVLTGLAAVLSAHIMAPVMERTYAAGQLAYQEARSGAALISSAGEVTQPLREFLIRHGNPDERARFVDLARELRPVEETSLVSESDLTVIVPAFVITELKEAFEIGFLVFLPFLVLDMVIANVLLALGMQTLSPSQVSLPFKILLFVAVDGWSLLARGLILGYR